MIKYVLENLPALALGYCLCVLVPMPFLEKRIRSAWFAVWDWLWSRTIGRLIPGPN